MKRFRQAIGERMREPDFDDICLKVLKDTTNPWEIETVKAGARQAVGEPWVSVKRKKSKSHEVISFDTSALRMVHLLQMLGSALHFNCDILVFLAVL